MLKKILKELSLPESYVSITLGFLVVVVAGLLLYNNFNKNNSGNVTSNETVQTQESTQEGKSETINEPLPTTHIVRESDSLWTIAEKYYGSGYNWISIANKNNLTNPDRIQVGQKLEIPKADKIEVVADKISSTSISRATEHTVVRGENLWNIAVSEYNNGFMWMKIATANNLTNPRIIHSGNVLKLPRD